RLVQVRQPRRAGHRHRPFRRLRAVRGHRGASGIYAGERGGAGAGVAEVASRAASTARRRIPEKMRILMKCITPSTSRTIPTLVLRYSIDSARSFGLVPARSATET